jgi:hypothetical protein
MLAWPKLPPPVPILDADCSASPGSVVACDCRAIFNSAD